jgi:hypothetical protein
VTITLTGLIAFNHDGSGGNMRALLPEARQPRVRIYDPTDPTKKVTIPAHVPLVTFDGPSASASFPWFLDGEDILITVNGSTQTHSVDTAALERLGKIKDINPNAGPVNDLVDDDTVPAELNNILVARVKLDHGKLTPPSSSDEKPPPDKFRAIAAANESTYTQDAAAQSLTYTIEAKSVTFGRRKFGASLPFHDLELKGGEYRVVVTNYPISIPPPVQVVTGYAGDYHFDWFYDLAAQEVQADQRYVPFYQIGGPVGPSGPRCMMGDF